MRELTKKQQTRIRKLVCESLEGLGATKIRVETKHSPPEYAVWTKAGRLTIHPYGDWIACRFDDPKAAAKVLNAKGMFDTRLNPCSGKWNFHYDFCNVDPQRIVEYFLCELKPILAEGEQPAFETGYPWRKERMGDDPEGRFVVIGPRAEIVAEYVLQESDANKIVLAPIMMEALEIIASGNTDPDRMVEIAQEALAGRLEVGYDKKDDPENV